MGEVVEPSFITTLDIPVERVLRKATDAKLTKVMVLGWDPEGEMYFAASFSDGGEALWLFEKAKKCLLEIE